MKTRTIAARQQQALRRMLALLLLGGAALLAVPAARAQFAMVPAPQCAPPPASAQGEERAYRADAARHLYRCYPARIHKGKLPPLLYGVMMVETELAPDGQVVDIRVVRKPAADEVAPWVLAMIRRASPFPAPAGLPGGTVRFTETFFVDKTGQFQVFSLTEGQN
jgi:periplasmic protein TonB